MFMAAPFLPPKETCFPSAPKSRGRSFKDDPNLLVATVKGHPVIFPNGISIDPALVLKNVSLLPVTLTLMALYT